MESVRNPLDERTSNIMAIADLDSLSDESLMKRYGQGNMTAFEILYGRHKGPLFRFVLRQVSERSEAEELFQDIWSKVISQRTDYHVSAKFSTWLYTIARHRVIDFYRVSSNQIKYLVQDSQSENNLGDEHTQGIDDSASPEVLLDSEKTYAQLKSIVGNLPDEQREAFILKYESGFNHRDIAEITGQKEETIKSQVRYALNKIKVGLFGGNHGK